ncbi:hypothetical protein Vi05172_g1787 [Venturia inaequalis]|nr:hypothetical protein Vi05172_g1787 [Venturia inaequalis]
MRIVSISTMLLMAATYVSAGHRTACVLGQPAAPQPGFCNTYDKNNVQIDQQICRGAKPCYKKDNGCLLNKERIAGVTYANCS